MRWSLQRRLPEFISGSRGAYRTLCQLALCLPLILTVAACETSVELDIPRRAPAIVINSFFWPDAEFELCLSEARDLIDGDRNIRYIEHASVELWEDESMLEVVPYVGDCLYRSPSKRPVPGREYTLRVSADGYEDVEATDFAPLPVPTEFEFEVDEEGSDAGSVDVTITLHDPPDTGNWYRLMLYYRDPTGRLIFLEPEFRTDDEAILAENQDQIEIDETGEFQTVFFSDALLDHGPNGHSLKIEVEPPVVVGGTFEGTFEGEDDIFATDPENVELLVFVDAISEHFHAYGTSVRVYWEVGNDPFSEPIQVWTNVENGLGIFGGFNRNALVAKVR